MTEDEEDGKERTRLGKTSSLHVPTHPGKQKEKINRIQANTEGEKTDRNNITTESNAMISKYSINV